MLAWICRDCYVGGARSWYVKGWEGDDRVVVVAGGGAVCIFDVLADGE